MSGRVRHTTKRARASQPLGRPVRGSGGVLVSERVDIEIELQAVAAAAAAAA